ncbi:hypothetical protein FA13DRAFT_65842 [Coprinellus micaceus]|uniref:Uncharacterized protein n=1 Tax=Coprinellus micaceus TaxID=71717 RepID=A0A4Y7TKP7_COPMI|nr:hypothetical protein FA13DRAFT_65842 [Coprinellus micaceus]
MKFTTFTAGALAAIFLPRVLAEDVTLFQLVEEPPSTTDSVIRSGYSIGITPISVEKSGETVYVAAEAHSKAVYTNRLMTLTLIPSPTTVTYTFRADASRYHLALETNVSGVKGTREDDCTTDPSTGKMVCVVRVIGKNDRTTQSVVATVTGTGAPWFTVTGVENLNLPTVDSGALPKAYHGEGGGGRMLAMLGLPVLGVLTGVLLL